MTDLREDNRQQLIQKSKSADSYALSNSQFGKNRYERRLKSQVIKQVKQFNQLDMNKLFKEDKLDVVVTVKGETSTYEVKISFDGFLDRLHKQLQNYDQLNLRVITRALTEAFNGDNVYINCSCPDWTYRHSYWANVNDISSDKEHEQKNNGKGIANPHDSKGPGCKHTLLVISNNSWLLKVASVIYNYINYMKVHQQKLFADVIYPAIYQKPYEGDVQLDMGDNKLSTSKSDIDVSNEYAKTKNRFTKVNQPERKGFTKVNTPVSRKQISFDDLE